MEIDYTKMKKATPPFQSRLLIAYVNCWLNNRIDSLSVTPLSLITLNLPEYLYNSQWLIYSHQNNLIFVHRTITGYYYELTV